MEQVIPGSCGGSVNQRIQEQTGQILERCGHLQLTSFTAHQHQVQLQDHVLPRPTTYRPTLEVLTYLYSSDVTYRLTPSTAVVCSERSPSER